MTDPTLFDHHAASGAAVVDPPDCGADRAGPGTVVGSANRLDGVVGSTSLPQRADQKATAPAEHLDGAIGSTSTSPSAKRRVIVPADRLGGVAGLSSKLRREDHRAATPGGRLGGLAGSASGSRSEDHRSVAPGGRLGDLAGLPAADAVAALFISPVVVGDLSDRQLEEHLVVLGRAKGLLAAMDAAAVAELARRRGEAEAAGVLRDKLKQSRSAAKRDVKQAGQLDELPGTAQALADGAITPQHARLIAEAAEAAAPGSGIDEDELLSAAQREPADRFGRTVRDHLNDRNRNNLTERRRVQRSQRRLSFKQQPDGMFEMFGRFDPVSGGRIETALAAMANGLWRGEDPKRRPNVQQRLADALEVLVTRGDPNADTHNGTAGRAGGEGSANTNAKSGATTKARSRTKTGTGAQGVDLLVIADYDILTGALRDARLLNGTPLSPTELVRLACDARILPALFDAKSQPLWLGRGKRHASAAQRAVLAERDKGCVGCGASASWCQAHHIKHWVHGGTTDLDNLCLLCSHCHHQVHDHGATITRDPHGKFSLQHPTRSSPTGSPYVNPPLRC